MTSIIVLVVGVTLGPGSGQWQVQPYYQSTTGWQDCESRAAEANRATMPLAVFYCKRIMVPS